MRQTRQERRHPAPVPIAELERGSASLRFALLVHATELAATAEHLGRVADGTFDRRAHDVPVPHDRRRNP